MARSRPATDMQHAPNPDPTEIQHALLGWYDKNARTLPWRIPPGASRQPDPYHVWLSEIMLQQTTVAAVIPYFNTFLERWPSVNHLADATIDEVTSAWAGLGYYARARNLHACAVKVSRDFGGTFPDTEEALLKLPGIGQYTAAAIASIAFNQPANVVDGNIERVVSRLHNVDEPLPLVKPRLRELAGFLAPQKRPGDYAQAMMDLGATVCIPKTPKCDLCPIFAFCLGYAIGHADELPRRVVKATKPVRWGLTFWVERCDGAVLLRRRPARGLLGGMLGFPGSDWTTDKIDPTAHKLYSPLHTSYRILPGTVRHTFTHFHLELTVFEGTVSTPKARDVEGDWVAASDLDTVGLPTVMRKVARHVREAMML